MAREAAKPKNETTYIVLHGNDGSTGLQLRGDTLANGPEQAVRRVAENEEGVFIAVPARNWTIVKQTSETPPPVISQEISKWIGLPEEEEETHETETVEEGDVASLTGDGAPRERVPAVPHPAETIEEDGA